MIGPTSTVSDKAEIIALMLFMQAQKERKDPVATPEIERTMMANPIFWPISKRLPITRRVDGRLQLGYLKHGSPNVTIGNIMAEEMGVDTEGTLSGFDVPYDTWEDLQQAGWHVD